MNRRPLTEYEAMLVRTSPDLGWPADIADEARDRAHPGACPDPEPFWETDPAPIRAVTFRDMVAATISAVVTFAVMMVLT